MKKKLLLGSIVLTLALSAVGCGNSSNEEDTTTTTTEAQSQ